MSDGVEAMIRSLADCPTYEQDEPGDAAFRFVLERDRVPGLQVGHVTLRGPIHKTAAAHDWHQAYTILRGEATIHLGERSQRVDGPTVVVIPAGTTHSVTVESGSSVEYLYINQYR